MIIREAKSGDLQELTEIYNYEVLNGVATLDYEPKSLADRKLWMEAHNTENHPLYVAEADGKVAGYASLSSYREKEAYKTTVELSVYIGERYRRMGVATALMEHILQEAKRRDDIYTVVSVITAGNEASRRLHEKFGFVFCGTIKEVGMKHGRLLDIENYQLLTR